MTPERATVITDQYPASAPLSFPYRTCLRRNPLHTAPQAQACCSKTPRRLGTMWRARQCLPSFSGAEEEAFLFATRKGTPLNMNNFLRRTTKPAASRARPERRFEDHPRSAGIVPCGREPSGVPQNLRDPHAGSGQPEGHSGTSPAFDAGDDDQPLHPADSGERSRSRGITGREAQSYEAKAVKSGV